MLKFTHGDGCVVEVDGSQVLYVTRRGDLTLIVSFSGKQTWVRESPTEVCLLVEAFLRTQRRRDVA